MTAVTQTVRLPERRERTARYGAAGSLDEGVLLREVIESRTRRERRSIKTVNSSGGGEALFRNR